MASIQYDNFEKGKEYLKVHNYQTSIYLIFSLMGQYVKTEVHSVKGRGDVEIETDNGIYIIKFKIGGSPEDDVEQIERIGYLEKYKLKCNNIILVGAVIDEDERTIRKWIIKEAGWLTRVCITKDSIFIL